MTDLYAILDIPSDASFDEIKAAHRAAVKKHHPDIGGDPEAFAAIQHAYEVLTDLDRRRYYDATGDDGDTPSEENSRNGELYSAAANLIQNAIARGADVKQANLIGAAKDECRAGIQNCKKTIADVERMQGLLEEAVSRITSADETNALALALRARLNQLSGQKRQNELAIKRWEDLIEFLTRFNYRVDQMPSHFSIMQSYSIILQREALFGSPGG